MHAAAAGRAADWPRTDAGYTICTTYATDHAFPATNTEFITYVYVPNKSGYCRRHGCNFLQHGNFWLNQNLCLVLAVVW
jgi:hypothetical protein